MLTFVCALLILFFTSTALVPFGRYMETQEYWRVLCEQVKCEQDPERLIKLVEKLNLALEEREMRDRFRFGPDPGSLDS